MHSSVSTYITYLDNNNSKLWRQNILRCAAYCLPLPPPACPQPPPLRRSPAPRPVRCKSPSEAGHQSPAPAQKARACSLLLSLAVSRSQEDVHQACSGRAAAAVGGEAGCGHADHQGEHQPRQHQGHQGQLLPQGQHQTRQQQQQQQQHRQQRGELGARVLSVRSVQGLHLPVSRWAGTWFSGD